jgi:hypothetical protein
MYALLKVKLDDSHRILWSCSDLPAETVVDDSLWYYNLSVSMHAVIITTCQVVCNLFSKYSSGF